MFSNIPQMHRATCQKLGPRPSLRFKKYGKYYDLSWTDKLNRVNGLAAGLIGLGIQKGDRVAMLAENSAEWIVSDLGILSAGAADVTLHAPLSPKQAAYQIGHSEARGIIVSNQAQADKIIAVLDELPLLEFMICIDPVKVDCRLNVMTLDGLIQRGKLAGPEAIAEVDKRVESLTSDDPITIIYTSGTTGNPKGVVLTHGNLTSNCQMTYDISSVSHEDILLSWLPYSHIYARTVDLYMTAYGGITLALAESVDTLVQNLAEIQPTWLTSVPRFYEKIWSSVEALPDEIRAKTLRKIFGPRLRYLSSGGAPLPVYVCKGFWDSGIPMLEGYGLTESSPVICFNTLEEHRPGTVGKTLPGVEVKIAEDGEILTKGPHVMKEYWKNEEATAETLKDGWLYTGDVGEIDEDGYLVITDRKKELIITSAGKNISPSELENAMLANPYIDQAVTYGDKRKFVSAILVPEFEVLGKKLKELGIEIKTEGEFIANKEIHDFYMQQVQEIMESFSNPERVKNFLILNRAFQLDLEELTPTLKVRRKFITGKYSKELDAFYES